MAKRRVVLTYEANDRLVQASIDWYGDTGAREGTIVLTPTTGDTLDALVASLLDIANRKGRLFD